MNSAFPTKDLLEAAEEEIEAGVEGVSEAGVGEEGEIETEIGESGERGGRTEKAEDRLASAGRGEEVAVVARGASAGREEAPDPG